MDAFSKLLRLDEVSEITTLAKSTIWLKISQNKFPKPIRISPSINVWRLSSLNAWLESHEEESNLEGARND